MKFNSFLQNISGESRFLILGSNLFHSLILKGKKDINLHQTQQKKTINKNSYKDPVEDIVVLSAGTILAIRQRLALMRDC